MSTDSSRVADPTERSAPPQGRRARCTVPSPRTTRLPVLETGPDGLPIRPSRAGRWRAISLLAVHVLMVAHILHWMSRGKTLTPIEPSEAMETIRFGRVNAGFVFFGVALLATVILGRWVCGWGCHLVAYQDLTNWVLKKLRLRPKAFRSRLLIYVPLIAALYMFVWPLVYRLAVGAGPPPLSWHFQRTGFWDTFPEYGVAILTVLVCGVAIIYFLGPKGFCTFACPYGAFFAPIDKLAVGRIRVTDACNRCGHCTAVCTSNVDVAQEVNLYRMVVDPGCMKCLDCVSVCPNDALYFGVGAPALGRKPLAAPRPRAYDLTIIEELAALIVFAAAFFSLRGLYGHVPFLMSLGLAAIVTFVVMKAARLAYAQDVLLQKVRLKIDGRVRGAGIAYAAFTTAVIAFIGNSSYWQYHNHMAQRSLAQLPPESFGWQRNAPAYKDAVALAGATIERAAGHLRECGRWGLLSTLDNQMGTTWLELLDGKTDLALAGARLLAESHPMQAGLWVRLANFQTFTGRFDDARAAFAKAMEIEKTQREKLHAKVGEKEPISVSGYVWAEWGLFLADRGETAQAQAALEKAVRYDNTSEIPWLALGSFQFNAGQIDAARRPLIKAVVLSPGDRQAAMLLEQLCRRDQDFSAALADYEAARAEQPGESVFLHNMAHTLARLGRYDQAAEAYRRLLEIRRQAMGVRADLGAVLLAQGDSAGAISQYEQLVTAMPNDAEALLKLGFLYQQAGRVAEAAVKYEAAARHGNADQQRTAREALQQLNGE